MSNPEINAVLTFWFEESTSEQWFKKSDTYDELIASRFGMLVEKALIGKLDDWQSEKEGLLALILLLDQFTRNIFRDSPKSFAGDEQALELSLEGQRRGYLKELNDNERHFLLVPMMHSESLDIQNASLPLFKQHTNDNVYGYAVAHRDIIEKFERFPHRNQILDRTSTQEEIEFLKQPGSSF